MPAPGCISGEIGLVGLFDLGQLLMLNHATGVLTVSSEGRSGYLYFEDGRVVNAVDEEYREGELAAYHVFAWRAGRFEFRAEAASGSHSIHIGTGALMLEAARQMDEARESEGKSDAPVETERLRERQGAMDALRDAFQDLAREAHVLGLGSGHGGGAPHLDALQADGDRLMFRPGHPPRLRQGGEWNEQAGDPMSGSDYEDVKTRLLVGSEPVPGESAELRRIRLPGGRTLEITRIGEGAEEALWLRPVELRAPDAELLEGSGEVLDRLLALETGLLLVGGPDAECTARLLHTLVSMLVALHGETLLLVSRDRTYRHTEEGGVLIRVSPDRLRSAIETVRPGIVVLEELLAPGDASLETLAAVPIVLAGVVTPEPAVMLPRWLSRVTGGDPHRAEGVLARSAIGLVMVQPPGASGAQSCAAWLLSEGERSMALAGETDALAASLARPTHPERRLRLQRA